jgi:Terpene cyclase DEP1
MIKSIYTLLAILGLVLPYSQFIPFILEHGFDIKLFFEQLFANKISGFFWNGCNCFFTRILGICI